MKRDNYIFKSFHLQQKSVKIFIKLLLVWHLGPHLILNLIDFLRFINDNVGENPRYGDWCPVRFSFFYEIVHGKTHIKYKNLTILIFKYYN